MVDIKKIFIAIIFVVLAISASADRLGQGDYILYDTINSGGLRLEQGNTTLTDSKGEGLGPQTRSGNYIYTPGILGLLATREPVYVDDFILFISRESETPVSGLLIWWDVTKINDPTIYMLLGEYSNTFTARGAFWEKVFANGSVLPFYSGSFEKVNAHTIRHKGQVGQGGAEIYYKALGTGESETIDFPFAPAVGKINVSLKGQANNLGKNLISVPFVQPINSVAEVFGEGSDSAWQEGDMVQSKIAPSPAYLTAVYTGGAWKNAANAAQPPAFNMDYKFGNWVITNADKVVTLVGKIIDHDQPVYIYDGAGLPTGGKTLLGMIYPVSVGLASTSLITNGAAEGDLIQRKINPLEPAYISAVVSGGVWKNAADTSAALDPLIRTLILPNSYIYVRYGSTGFTWDRKKPY